MTRHWRLIVFLLPIGVVALGGAGYFFFLAHSQGDPVGIIARCSYESRRKPAYGYLWLRLTMKTLVYAGDALQTGPEGFATIRLVDGSAIELEENSMVVMGENEAKNFDDDSTPIRVRIPKGENHLVIFDEEGKPKLRELPDLPGPSNPSRRIAGLFKSVRDGSRPIPAATPSPNPSKTTKGLGPSSP